MRKIAREIILCTASVGFLSLAGYTQSNQVAASAWHKGMPRAMKGLWYSYYKGKPGGALHVVKSAYTFHQIRYSTRFHAYYVFNISFDWVQNTKYRYIGSHKYRVTGIVEGGEAAGNAGKRRTVTFSVTKHHLRTSWATWTKKRPNNMISSKKGSKYGY